MGHGMATSAEGRYLQLVEAAKAVTDDDAALRLIRTIRDEYGLAHAHYRAECFLGMEQPIMVTTMPEQWLERYAQRGYHLWDPVLEAIRKDRAPVEWKVPEEGTDIGSLLLKDARQFGMGAGASIPLFTGSGPGQARIVIVARGDDHEWEDRKALVVRDILLLGQHLHGAVMRSRSGAKVAAALSDRQKECLRLLASGLNLTEASISMEITERTAKRYLDEARSRLNAKTTAHAVSRAICLGILQAA